MFKLKQKVQRTPLVPVATRFWSKVYKTKSCWEWRAAKVGKYGVFGYKRKLRYAHRVSWMLTKGIIPKGKHVLHRCDNCKCVRPSHLFLGTPQDNTDDMFAKGRARKARGEQNNAKLTKKQVQEIRIKYNGGALQRELAVEYTISQGLVSHIVCGRNWRHV